MSSQDYIDHGELKLIVHQIYEYKKGVRKLILCTTTKACARIAIQKLRKNGIRYIVRRISADKVNLFFGHTSCLKVVKLTMNKPLNQLSAEEDFILGTMLGYDLTEQCNRLLNCKTVKIDRNNL